MQYVGFDLGKVNWVLSHEWAKSPIAFRRSSHLSPQPFKPNRRRSRVPNRMLNASMPQIILY